MIIENRTIDSIYFELDKLIAEESRLRLNDNLTIENLSYINGKRDGIKLVLDKIGVK